MEYIPSKERARVIRVALAEKFGTHNVSVKKGTGTASSWVNAYIYGERPADCTCKWSDTYWNGEKAPKPYRADVLCEACKIASNTLYEQGKQVSNEAMQKAGYEHSTFTADDGYNSEHSEFILQVDIK
jgi:hypothetical protein